MKAVVVYEVGGVDKLMYQDVPMPSVKPGWSLVKVKGFGINRSEILQEMAIRNRSGSRGFGD